MDARPLLPAYDAIVVGARAAGASTALLLARAGLRVLAVERARPGTDTLSTHALMRGGVLQLHRWGLLDAIRAAGTPALSSTAFHYGDETIAIPIKPADGVDALYAPRRTVLDRILAEAAAEAGAHVLHRARVAGLLTNAGGRVCGAFVEDAGGGSRAIGAGIVVGADGIRSTVARETGAETVHRGTHRTGVAYGYVSGLPRDCTHWHYRAGAGAGMIPTNDGLACVFAAVPATRFRDEIAPDMAGGFHRVLHECDPDLARAVRAGRPHGPLRGWPGEPGHLRRAWGPGWALVGDAGYFRDPFTAHGLTDAMRDAELLARAILGGEAALATWQAQRDDLSRRFLDLSDRVASFAWDMPGLQAIHTEMSREMKREVEVLKALDAERTAA